MRFQKKIKNHFIKVVLLINLVYFGEHDCLSLELNIYKTYSENILENRLNFGFAYLIWAV